MNRLKKLIALFLFTFLFNFGKAQIKFSKEIKDTKTNTTFAKLDESLILEANSKNELLTLKKLSPKSEDYKFEYNREYSDDLGYKHKVYNIVYKGYEIYGMNYVIHEKNNKILYLNGNIDNLSGINTKTKISQTFAIKIASGFYESKFSKNSSIKSQKNLGLFICNAYLTDPNNYKLAYKILIESNNSSLDSYIFIDAISGNTISYENLACNTNAPGTAQTKYSGSQNLVADFQGSNYRLREVRNGVNILTLNANNQSDETIILNSATDFLDNSNTWTFTSQGFNQAATDAHWASEKVVDYWKLIHNRNSIDNLGIDVKSYIHVNMPQYNNDNAYWSKSKNAMFFADGGTDFRILTSLDVCAHEFGHGICQFTSDLSYAANSESQALNEGFSDIWGASIEAYAAPNKQRWLIGEEITIPNPGYLRSMSNPPSGAFRPSSDTYGDARWNAQPDGHFRSGVLNKWYFLLSDGGSGTNGIGNGYNVVGITISKAEKIAYRTEQLLNSSANYAMARTMSIQAVQELYGTNSCEQKAVEDAWYAVGVGAPSGINNYTIAGQSTLCINPITYSINPAPANVIWSVSNNQIISDLIGSSIKLTRNGFIGSFTISATITTSCGVTQLTKQIQAINGDVPSPYSFTPYITQGGSTTYMSNYCNQITASCSPNSAGKVGTPDPNAVSPYSWCASGYITDPTVNSISWSVLQTSAGIFHGSYSFTGNQFTVSINGNYPNEWIILRCTRTNACGPTYNDYRFYKTQYCSGPNPTFCQLYPNDPSCPQAKLALQAKNDVSKIGIAPNPTSGQFVITLNTIDKFANIKEIIVKDKMGNVVHRQTFANNQKQQQINLSSKPNDIYVVEIFDGKTWVSQKLILQH